MLGYIVNEDVRGKALLLLLQEKGIESTEDQKRIIDADFLYLGIHGKAFLETTFKKGSRVYTLVYNKDLEVHCQQQDVTYEYLYSDYRLVQGNTFLTTEALLGYMISHNSISIMHSQILIIGYGNCGKDLAKKCKALEANVTVTNRGEHHRGAVQKHGYNFVPLEELMLDKYDFVINTVPHPVLDSKILKTRKASCQIYDIASAPYGIKKEDQCPNYYILGGLPAKYAYLTATKLIYKAIQKKEEIYVKR